MKFILPALVCALSQQAFAFTSPALVSTGTREQPLNAFFKDFFDDRFDRKDDEDAKNGLFRRLTKPIIKEARRKAGDFFTRADDENLPSNKDGIFEHVPPKSMTGVDPIMSRLCATISSQVYSSEKLEDFRLSTKDIKAEAILYDDHGKFGESSPPFVIVVTGKTLILGWRGTQSMMDMINDAAFAPQSSPAWRAHHKSIKSQGAFNALVQNDLINHEEFILNEVKKRGITEIITTGQSLGGGSAQVGHLVLRAQKQDKSSPWSALGDDVNVRSVAFCGPMTTVLIDNDDDHTDAFLEELWNNSCNFIYSNDIVPRGYGYLNFIEDFIEDAGSDLIDGIPIPKLLKNIFDVKEKFEDLYEAGTSDEKVVAMIEVASQYRHIGNLIYYKSEDAKPIVLKDMGAFYKNTKKEGNVLRDVKYRPVKNPMDEFMGWHMDIINGPGLSFHPEKELLKSK